MIKIAIFLLCPSVTISAITPFLIHFLKIYNYIFHFGKFKDILGLKWRTFLEVHVTCQVSGPL